MSEFKDSIQQWVFKRHYLHVFKERGGSYPFPHYDRIKRVLVMGSDDSLSASFRKEISELLQEEGKSVYFWTFSKGRYRSNLEKDIFKFVEEDFNWLGVLKRSIRRQFVDDNYDLLLDLRSEWNICYDYLALYAKAKFKVGQKGFLYPYQMCVDVGDWGNSWELLRQIIFYLKSIKSHD